MDDLTGKINQLLSDPEAMEQIMSLKNMLVPENSPSETPSPPPPKEEPKSNNSIIPTSFLQDDIMKSIMKIVPLLSDIKKDDDTTKLLKALRPFLSKERRSKLDEAMKMLQVIKILPVIKRLNL